MPNTFSVASDGENKYKYIYIDGTSGVDDWNPVRKTFMVCFAGIYSCIFIFNVPFLYVYYKYDKARISGKSINAWLSKTVNGWLDIFAPPPHFTYILHR